MRQKPHDITYFERYVYIAALVANTDCSCWMLYRYRRSEVQRTRTTLYTQTDANGYAVTSLTKAFTDPKYNLHRIYLTLLILSYYSLYPASLQY